MEVGVLFMHCPRVAPCVALTLLLVAGQPARAGRRCDAPPETWQPRSAVSALAERNGWQIDRLKVDDGCYEIKGRDADGRRFKAMIDPPTLKVIGIRREHGEGDHERGRDRGGERQRPAPPASTPAVGSTGGLTPAPTSGLG
jgi:hypothetical protein